MAFNWLKKLGENFGQLIREPSWQNGKEFLKQNWLTILLFLVIFFILSWIVSKIFESLLKIALVIIILWFVYMLLFKRKELMQGIKNLRKNWKDETSQQANSS